MELISGLKRTEAGVIPEDWRVETIANCCDYADYRGKTPPKTPSGIFLITARNVRKGFIDYSESQEYVPINLYEEIMRRGKPRIGDVLITTEAPLGNVAQVDREDVALAQRIIKYRPKTHELYPDYLKYYFLSSRFQEILNAHGSGTTAKGIKGRVLHQLPVVLPSPEEQRAISTVLIDLDSLIVRIEQFIAKKRDLKQAVMQQLLTGQTRLPGFSGSWKTKTLGEIATIKDGTHQTPNYVPSGIPFYSVEHVTSGDFANTKFISEDEHQFLTKSYKIEKGDILMTRIGSIGDCKLIDWDVNASFYVSLALLKIQPGNSAAYVVHYSRSVSFQNEIEIHSLPSAIPRKINLGPISKIKIVLPELNEQNAIASVLTDMDAELAILEQRLAKTRDLKQAMMQELLTGKTRLVTSEAIHA